MKIWVMPIWIITDSFVTVMEKPSTVKARQRSRSKGFCAAFRKEDPM